MAREIGDPATRSEPQLALANFHLGRLSDPRVEAEQLAGIEGVDQGPLAELWLAIGDHEQARKHAIAAYKDAWADGEPYVYRYQLSKAAALLERLGVPVPELPRHDPEKDDKLPWEDEVAAAIEKLRAKKEKESPAAE